MEVKKFVIVYFKGTIINSNDASLFLREYYDNSVYYCVNSIHEFQELVKIVAVDLVILDLTQYQFISDDLIYTFLYRPRFLIVSDTFNEDAITPYNYFVKTSVTVRDLTFFMDFLLFENNIQIRARQSYS